MHVFEEKLRAPEFKEITWLDENAPLSLRDLRGQIIVIDFWDYTCVNCLNTLPYLKEWHHRYARYGLKIVGIHAPEFTFSKNIAQVKAAVERFELPYAIGLDNGFRTWNAYANRAWPAKYLIDEGDYIRAFHSGEGAYQAFEREIQRLLEALHPAADFPDPMRSLKPADEPGAVCLPPTPELYLGYGRGEIGNVEKNPAEQTLAYPPVEDPARAFAQVDTVYLQGVWFHAKEYVESRPENGVPCEIHLNYRAAEVNVVLEPPEDGGVSVELRLDDRPLPDADRGPDVERTAGETSVSVTRPGMLALVRHAGLETHRLTLRFTAPGVRAYAFTFVGCVSDDTAFA